MNQLRHNDMKTDQKVKIELELTYKNMSVLDVEDDIKNIFNFDIERHKGLIKSKIIDYDINV